ncbi:unnamed protein product [Durusdinium trenchii]|uniref:Ubiquitin-like domain-containing protein n=1 Tax=Durusdinium trenchii TaxID=1381693 RepID=A0ABP0SN18_9DINO
MSTDLTDGVDHGVSCGPTHEDGVLEIQAVGLDGDECSVRVPASLTGRQLRKIISDKLPPKAGARVALQQGPEMLLLDKTLRESFGLVDSACVTYVYIPASLYEAWRLLSGLPVADHASALEGMTQLEGLSKAHQLETLPRGLHSLVFGFHFSQSLETVTLPSQLRNLSFGRDFNQSLAGVTFPESLESMTLGQRFNQSLNQVNWPGLRHLTLGDSFNQSLEKVSWPKCLQSLTFGRDFNQSLTGVALPSTLQSLTFGDQFNQSLKGVTLPASLQILVFGYLFNQTVDDVLWPRSLESLTFGDDFNQTLDALRWPQGLKHLSCGDFFNQPLDRVCWPTGLQSLRLGHFFNQRPDGVTWPRDLQTLTLGDEFASESFTWPRHLRSLSVGKGFKGFKGWRCEESHSPSCLETLVCCELHHLDETLPANSSGFKQRWDRDRSAMWGGLKHLSLGEFNQPVDAIRWPEHLETLTLGDEFNQTLDGVQWPEGLLELKLGNKFNQSLQQITSWPGGLQSLSLGDQFNQTLEKAERQEPAAVRSKPLMRRRQVFAEESATATELEDEPVEAEAQWIFVDFAVLWIFRDTWVGRRARDTTPKRWTARIGLRRVEATRCRRGPTGKPWRRHLRGRSHGLRRRPLGKTARATVRAPKGGRPKRRSSRSSWKVCSMASGWPAWATGARRRHPSCKTPGTGRIWMASQRRPPALRTRGRCRCSASSRDPGQGRGGGGMRRRIWAPSQWGSLYQGLW